jgi:tRNA A37 methylthiotransferase MiaB
VREGLPLRRPAAAARVGRRAEADARPGNRQTYDKLLARIRDRVPGVTLRTTFIVGFPGETDAEFAELESFVEDTRFDHIGVFTYSHEKAPAPTRRRRRAGRRPSASGASGS